MFDAKRHEAEKVALENLRNAINEAVKAGCHIGAIKSVVSDQILGIQQLGGGDVDKMLEYVAKCKAEAEAYIRSHYDLPDKE